MHHIALHDFVPGLTQIAISPLGDVPVIRAEFAGLVRRRVNAGVCDENIPAGSWRELASVLK